MNVYLAQPMAGHSDEEIEALRSIATRIIAERHHDKSLHILNTFRKEWNEDNMSPIMALGKAFGYLAEADVAYFAGEWEDSRGCQIEWAVCELYGIPHAALDI